MAALVSRTKVGEKRRTWRGIVVSTIMRRFNIEALSRRRQEKTEKPFKGRRVEGSFRVQYFMEFMNDFIETSKLAKESLGAEVTAKLLESLDSNDAKAGPIENDEMINNVQVAVRKSMKAPGAEERKSGYSPTSIMDGKIDLKALAKYRGDEPIVDDEIIARGIPTRLEEWTKEFGEVEDDVKVKRILAEMKFAAKKDLLRSHETRKIMLLNNFSNFNDTKKATTAIEPVGPMLLEKLRRQRSANEQSES